MVAVYQARAIASSPTNSTFTWRKLSLSTVCMESVGCAVQSFALPSTWNNIIFSDFRLVNALQHTHTSKLTSWTRRNNSQCARVSWILYTKAQKKTPKQNVHRIFKAIYFRIQWETMANMNHNRCQIENCRIRTFLIRTRWKFFTRNNRPDADNGIGWHRSIQANERETHSTFCNGNVSIFIANQSQANNSETANKWW